MRDFMFSLVILTVIASPALAGAPLKGVDIKLGKNPGGKPAARINATGSNYSISTGTEGGVDFRVAPQGAHPRTPSFKRK